MNPHLDRTRHSPELVVEVAAWTLANRRASFAYQAVRAKADRACLRCGATTSRTTTRTYCRPCAGRLHRKDTTL